MPVVCEHIFFFRINPAVVFHCDSDMQVFDFNIIIVIFPLFRHGIVRFHKFCSVGFKLAPTCSSIIENLQDILRDIHNFCVVTLTKVVTPHIVHTGIGICCILLVVYVNICRGECGFSLQVSK